MVSVCAGCGRHVKGTHPVVGVLLTREAEALPTAVPLCPPSPRGFTAVAVCGACHQDPAHRVYPLKAHFFAAGDQALGVQMAGTNQVFSTPVGPSAETP